MCCSLLLVVSDVLVNKEVDKLSSSIRIPLQLITVIKEIIASGKHWFFCSLHTLSSKSPLSLMPLPMNLSPKRLCRAKNVLAVLHCPLRVAFCRMLKRKFAIISHLSLRPQKCFLTSTQANSANHPFNPTYYSWHSYFISPYLTEQRLDMFWLPTAFFLRHKLWTYSPTFESHWAFLLKNERPLHTIQHSHVCIESKEPTKEVRCCCDSHMIMVTWQPVVKKIWTITEGLLELGTSCCIK